MNCKNHWNPRLCLLAVCCAIAHPAAALDFSGYVRAGSGGNTKKGAQQCFQLSGAAAKYRLGNECEQLSELTLRQTVAQFSDGSGLSLTGMGLLYNQYDRTPKFKSSDPHNDGHAKMV